MLSANNVLVALALVGTASAAMVPNLERKLPPLPPMLVCPREEAACAADPACAKCEALIAPKPAVLATCQDLYAWFASINVPLTCFDIENPGNLSSDLIYCRYDFYAQGAGLECQPGGLAGGPIAGGPTANPVVGGGAGGGVVMTMAPSAAPSAAPSDAPTGIIA